MGVEYKQATLPNGLTVLGEIDPEAHTAACGFFVRTGARDESSDIMGVSHFLEHMLFKGTATRSAADVNLEFDQLGAEYNAFTSNEMTGYWAWVLPENLPAAADLLADIMRPALRDDDFNSERGVILEEIAMYQDMPFSRLYDPAVEAHYKSHPLSNRVLGTTETVSAMTPEQMRAYFDQRYSPDCITVTLAGRIEFDAMTADIKRLCGSWEPTGAQREHPELQRSSVDLTLDDERAARHYYMMIAAAPPIQDESRYAADILAHLIGDSEGSLLYWALVDPGLADEAQFWYDGRDGLGEFYAFASCSPERAEQVETVINDTLAHFLDRVTDDDLERLRNKIATLVTLHGERPAGRMRRLGKLGVYDLPYRTLDEELERIQAVTLADVRAVADAFPLTNTPTTTARLRPQSP
ncbi:MAG: insulinase family protein [Planctomycetes bacterium]|nr:insulinase family protein [Planctomycetota bacterium]NOG55586.1 insulinase family protein [Planctomycetota bacterium]